ncbi:MAG: DUF4465 domain-containing protein [Chitinophagales bacterium]
MRKIILLLALLGNFSIYAQTTATFDDLGLALDTFAERSVFNSGHAQFKNVYSGGFFSGFAVSTKRDSVTAGAANQFSSKTARGVNGSNAYGICNTYGDAVIRLFGGAEGHTVKGCYVTNTTFAYLSMKNGDAFAKKFGGVSGNDPDWFRLTVKAWLRDTIKPQQVDFFLADFRDANNANDYIINNWQWLNLQTLGDVDSLFFELNSTDTAGGFGMNTPAYFALDNFITTDGVSPQVVALNDSIITPYNQPRTVNVLSNDTFETIDSVAIAIVRGPQLFGASATVDSNQIIYTPALGLIGIDTVWYSLCENGSCDTAMLIADVRGITANGIDYMETDQMQLSPNPFNNRIAIQANLPIRDIVLYDVHGRKCVAFETNANVVDCDVSSIPAGTYILEVRTSNQVIRKITAKQ